MKTKLILTTILGIAVSFAAVSQNELDDMYFNSKDRAKLNSKKISADIGLAQRDKSTSSNKAQTQLNPTDSYSARNVNPEYSAQLNSSANPNLSDENVEYFNSSYQPTGVNQSLSNCNCDGGSYYNPYNGQNSFNNPYYGNTSGFGSRYGSYYSSPWGNPYNSFRPGLSMSLGYGLGGYNSGFNNGFNNGFGYGANNFWSPYGYNSPWGNSYYPNQVIILNADNGGRQVVNGKRVSRSTSTNNVVDRTRVSNGVASSDRTIRSGRTRTSQPEYYEQGWKRNQQINTSRGYSNSGTQQGVNTRSSYNWGNSTNTGGRQTRSSDFSSPSRNSFNSGGSNSGGTRGGSSGSSTGGRTRGRNN